MEESPGTRLDRLITTLQYILGAVAIAGTVAVLLFGIQSCAEVQKSQNQLFYQTINNCTASGGTWVNTDVQDRFKGMCVKSK